MLAISKQRPIVRTVNLLIEISKLMSIYSKRTFPVTEHNYTDKKVSPELKRRTRRLLPYKLVHPSSR